MTGRRPRTRREAGPAVPRDHAPGVQVVCGCRPGRPPLRIADWLPAEDGRWIFNDTRGEHGHTRPAATCNEHGRWDLVCPNCGVHVQRGDAEVAATLTRAETHRRLVLDLRAWASKL